MAKIFKGTEVKFAIELTAPGFSMDENDFEIEVVSNGGGSIKGYKNPPQGASTDVVVFKDSDKWYAIADTSKLGTGAVRVIATAHIPDTNANDGIRNEIAMVQLGTLATA